VSTGSLLAVELDGELAERAQLVDDVVAEPHPRDPRWQHRVVVELVAEAGRLLEEGHGCRYRQPAGHTSASTPPTAAPGRR
jgi:hypothetical protein